jgi:hypothetical protein
MIPNLLITNVKPFAVIARAFLQFFFKYFHAYLFKIRCFMVISYHIKFITDHGIDH